MWEPKREIRGERKEGNAPINTPAAGLAGKHRAYAHILVAVSLKAA